MTARGGYILAAAGPTPRRGLLIPLCAKKEEDISHKSLTKQLNYSSPCCSFISAAGTLSSVSRSS